MDSNQPRLIDMDMDGRFRPSPGRGMPVSAKVLRIAVIVAALAGMLAAALLALWLALALIPVAVIAGLVAWATFRFQMWRVRRGYGRSVRRF